MTRKQKKFGMLHLFLPRITTRFLSIPARSSFAKRCYVINVYLIDWNLIFVCQLILLPCIMQSVVLLCCVFLPLVLCETYEENTNWKVDELLDRGEKRDKVIGNILRHASRGIKTSLLSHNVADDNKIGLLRQTRTMNQPRLSSSIPHSEAAATFSDALRRSTERSSWTARWKQQRRMRDRSLWSGTSTRRRSDKCRHVCQNSLMIYLTVYQ